MPRIDESDLDVGNEPPFVARKVVIKKGQNPRLDYTFSDELGRGRFGTVLMCTENKTKLKLAAKFVSTRHKEEKDNVEREVDIMKSLQHRRLMQLYDVYDDGKGEMCIITELISGGELFERVIDDDFELTEKVCAIFMRQICEGVDYMHENYIMHLDMKPENILCVTRTGNRIKLIDFGLARRYDPSKTLQVMFGTPDFASPEVLSYERVTPAADMWSVGVICYVLLSGLSPFMGNTDLETMTNVTKAVYDFDDESFDPISDDAKDFISKLLVKDPNRRLKPNDCLNHKWLAKTPAKKGKVTKLSKTKLKKYVVRRRWQKAVTAIMALTRMGANLSLTGALAGGAAPAKGITSPAKTTTATKSATSTTTTTTRPRGSTGTSTGISSRPPTSTPTPTSTAAATNKKTSSSMSTTSSTSSNYSRFGNVGTKPISTLSSKPISTSFSSRPISTSLSSKPLSTSSTSSTSATSRTTSPSSPLGSSRFVTSSSSSYRVTSSTTRRRF